MPSYGAGGLQKVVEIPLFFEKRNLDSRNKNGIIILTEPTTPLIFMRNPVGLFHLWGVLCINIQNKYEGEVPVWAVVEVLSFGTLSKIIKNLKAGTGSTYSILAANYQYISRKGNFANPSQKMFTSWVQAVSVLRNMCAHNSRIYNQTIHTTPEILDADKVTPAPAHNGLYQILLAMKYLRSSDKEWTGFVAKLEALFQKNSSVISLAAMNFPADWKEHLSV